MTTRETQPDLSPGDQKYHLFFESLANRSRMEILSSLKRGPKCVKELAHDLGRERSSVSHALRELLRCNLVFVNKKGRKRVYKLNDDTLEPLLELVDAHERKYCNECVKLLN
ncbi:MAG: metalloregulator ArsR/SmtB family transcription factor [Candidatus Bipolaricaulota bacterium]|nr:winged helix-turn-helix transcriptional regulator [Candidatus Bipolaricaulota bacterium]